MKRKLGAVIARFNETDRRLMAAAIQSHAFERQAVAKRPVPLSYRPRLLQTRYVSDLRLKENALRRTATDIERWRVAMTPTLEVFPLRNAFALKGIVAPAAVRFQQTRRDFFLVRMTCRIAVTPQMSPASMRLGLEFDPRIRTRGRRTAAYSVFPLTEGRQYRGTDVLFGLRPNLSFWVPRTPSGTAFVRTADMNARVRRLILVGPMRMSFRRFWASGTGAGSSRGDWQVERDSPEMNAGTVDSWMVLRVPKDRTSIAIEAELEAAVRLPAVLKSLVGSRRLVRGARRWTLRLPKLAAATPVRRD